MSLVLARVLGALSLSIVMLGLVALPVAAGPASPQTLVVDDNGSQCPAAAYTSIQEAIDDANPGDTVRVCAGHYPEQLKIDKSIKVRAVKRFRAHIDVPGSLAPTGPTFAAVAITANNVVFRGFRIHIEAGEAIPRVRPSLLSCVHVDAAILVLGTNVRVRNNKIDATGDDTLSGVCGYDYGIVVGQHAETTVAGAVLSVSATAKLTFNWVTDFKRGGILIEENDSHALVKRNTLRYLHLNDNGGLGDVVAGRTTGINGLFVLIFGIGVESGAVANVVRNAVYSGRDSCVGICPGGTPALNWGIALTNLDPAETTTVFHNSVYRTIGGIVANEGGDGAVISYNRVTTSHYGYQLRGNSNNVHHNRAVGNEIGFSVDGSENNIHDNIASGSAVYDCDDDTTGTGTADTDNTWTNNIGQLASPSGICT